MSDQYSEKMRSDCREATQCRRVLPSVNKHRRESTHQPRWQAERWPLKGNSRFFGGMKIFGLYHPRLHPDSSPEPVLLLIGFFVVISFFLFSKLMLLNLLSLRIFVSDFRLLPKIRLNICTPYPAVSAILINGPYLSFFVAIGSI